MPDGPWLRYVHRAVRPTQVGRNTGGIIEVRDAGKIFARVPRLDGDVLRRKPALGRRGGPVHDGFVRESSLCKRSLKSPDAYLVPDSHKLLEVCENLDGIASEVNEVGDAEDSELLCGIGVAGDDGVGAAAALSQNRD